MSQRKAFWKAHKQGLRGGGEHGIYQEVSVTKITSKQVGRGRRKKVKEGHIVEKT